MARVKFGAFLAPHHPIGEHPMLQFRRDLDLVEQLDSLGYDEFWCGEHHSSGWEMIASPEMFLAAAGERTKRIRLGTGVISLPALAAEAAGPASLLAWLALILLSVPLAATFAALGSRHPDGGGVSTYARRAFGTRAATVVG